MALSIPIWNERYEATSEALRRRSLHSIEDSKGMASMTFFNKVQLMARRAADLPLKSLTLVYRDPIARNLPPFMDGPLPVPCGFDVYIQKCIPKIDSDVGIARAFNAIKFPNETVTEFWTARMEYCRWKLRKPHCPRSTWPGGYYNEAEIDEPGNYWGDQGLDVRMATVDRVYTGTRIVSSRYSGSWRPISGKCELTTSRILG